MVRKASTKSATKGSKRKERRNSGVGTRRNSMGGKPRRNSIGGKPRRNSIGGKRVSVKRRATRKKISNTKAKKSSTAKKRSVKKVAKRRVSSRPRVSANKKRKRKSGKRAGGRKVKRRKRNAQQKPAADKFKKPAFKKPVLQAKCSSNLGSVMFSPYNYKMGENNQSPHRSIVKPHPSLAILKKGKLGDESAVVWANAFKVASPKMSGAKMNRSAFDADSSGNYETSTEVSISDIDPEELKSLNRSKSQPFKKVTPHHSIQYSFHAEANDVEKLSRTEEAKLRKEHRNNTSVLNISYAKGKTPVRGGEDELSMLDTTLQLTLATPQTQGRRSSGKGNGGIKKNNKVFFQSLNTPKSKPGGGMSKGAALKIVNSFAVARKRQQRIPPGEGVSFQRIDSYF